jgi:hypothetical protein
VQKIRQRSRLREINQQGRNSEVCHKKSLIEKSSAILSPSVEENNKGE